MVERGRLDGGSKGGARWPSLATLPALFSRPTSTALTSAACRWQPWPPVPLGCSAGPCSKCLS